MSASTTVRWAALASVLACAAGFGVGAGDRPASRPVSNLDYWLNQAGTVESQPAIADPTANPLGPGRGRIARTDALPGVVVLSDGKVIPGYVFTTRDKNWEVWSAAEKRWRHIPPIVVLSIRAVLVEEKLDNEWRWKEMGSDEKIFTGRKRPVRRLDWKLHLIDGSTVIGSIKGQPVWVEYDSEKHGPFVLHERSAGKYGQTLKDLVYVKAIVISRRALSRGLDYQSPTSQPAG